MFTVTKDLLLPTTVTGSWPKPGWYDQGLGRRTFKEAMGESAFREQYLDCVSVVLTEQETAGLDIVTDGDARFDLAVGGKSWFFYPIDRLGGFSATRDVAPGWSGDFGIEPGHILHEVQEAYQPPVLTAPVEAGPLQYAEVWRTAQRLTDRPVKFGSVSAQTMSRMMWNEHYSNDHEFVLAMCDVINQELRSLADAGCNIIQVEDPRPHMLAIQEKSDPTEIDFLVEAFNREVRGVNAEIWAHTCWGNPSQQRMFWEVPSYREALPHLFELNADVVTFECASSDGRDFPLFAEVHSDKKIAIGVVSHTNTVVEPPEVVADRIRRALEHVPLEQLIVSTDCGFGREGLSRRIAYFKTVALVKGTNIVRRELGLAEAEIRGADSSFAFS